MVQTTTTTTRCQHQLIPPQENLSPPPGQPGRTGIILVHKGSRNKTTQNDQRLARIKNCPVQDLNLYIILYIILYYIINL